MDGWLHWFAWFLAQIFGFLFFTFWGWMILIFVLGPPLRARLQTYTRRRAFYRARRAELANPHNASVRFLLGRIHYDGRQLRRALAFFREAVTLNATHASRVDPKLYQLLGHTLRRLRHFEEAIVAYEAGLAQAPESGRGESETGIGLCYRKLGALDDAEAWFRQAARINQSLIEPRLRLCSLLGRRGAREEAASLLRETRGLEVPDYLQRKQRRWRFLAWIFPLVAPLL